MRLLRAALDAPSTLSAEKERLTCARGTRCHRLVIRLGNHLRTLPLRLHIASAILKNADLVALAEFRSLSSQILLGIFHQPECDSNHVGFGHPQRSVEPVPLLDADQIDARGLASPFGACAKAVWVRSIVRPRLIEAVTLLVQTVVVFHSLHPTAPE